MAASLNPALSSRGTASPEAPPERVLVITRVLDAPRDLVFKVWTQPDHLVRWWGPKGFTLPSCKAEFRPGGAYRYVMRSPEGTEYRLVGTFREVAAPERLVFTFAGENEDGKPGPETLVTLTFAEQGAKTKLTLHQAVFESVTARDAHGKGWSGALDCLADYVKQAAQEARA
jgi:uncharacterized protein YndB with AHSA1/START domain